jgi:hypothetical protein
MNENISAEPKNTTITHITEFRSTARPYSGCPSVEFVAHTRPKSTLGG